MNNCRLDENYQIKYKNWEKIVFLEFINFVEAFIHNTLYLANVYPKEAFYDFKIYNIALKFIVDDTVSHYISQFLKNIENFIFSRFINKIYVLIIDADAETDTASIIEIYNLEVDFFSKFYGINYDELCLTFKSILNKFYVSNVNIKDRNPLLNKTFSLCIETKESNLFTNRKSYDDIVNNTNLNFVKNLSIYNNNKRDVCIISDNLNFSISLYKNYL